MEDFVDMMESDDFKTDLKIRSQKIWGRKSKRLKGSHVSAPLVTPVSFIYSAFNTSSPGGAQREFMASLGPRPNTIKVLEVLQSLQALDFRRFQPNIRFNFMIGGDGVVYRGRGWRHRPSLPRRHLYNYNHSLYIGFIGYWHDEPPDESLFQLRDELIRIGIHKGIIKEKHLQVTLPFPNVYKFNFESYVK